MGKKQECFVDLCVFVVFVLLRTVCVRGHASSGGVGGGQDYGDAEG